MPLKSTKPLRSKKRLVSKTPLKSRSKLKSGKKHEEWEIAKNNLKQMFFDLGISSCEVQLDGCWKTNGLTYAHAQKRRYLTKDTLLDVALCCVECHIKIEALPHDEMQTIIYNIIQQRNRGMYDKPS